MYKWLSSAMNDREKQQQRFSRLNRAVNEGDDELAAKLRKEIDNAPPDPYRPGPATTRAAAHTCCPSCRGA